MTCSLIVTTYNWKEALELVLQSIVQQSRLPDEVVVADDGSRDDTRALIEQIRAHYPIPLIHAWQEDDGFRAARSRNNAIARASGDYIILIDGDMVLHPKFVEDHLRCAKRRCFVQGSRVLLDASMTQSAIVSAAFRAPSFFGNVGNRKNMLRLGWLSHLICQKQSRSLSGTKTCNMAFFREDAFTVNGFNEAFTSWGREDTEFAARMINAGILRRNLKFSAVAYHLFHREGSLDTAKSDRILEATLRERLTWAKKGLSLHKV